MKYELPETPLASVLKYPSQDLLWQGLQRVLIESPRTPYWWLRWRFVTPPQQLACWVCCTNHLLGIRLAAMQREFRRQTLWRMLWALLVGQLVYWLSYFFFRVVL